MTGEPSGGVAVRPADPDDALDVRRVVDGALLDVPEDLDDRIRAGDVLVAADDGSVVGAIVLDGSHVEAVAVRRRRRGDGVGSELVDAAAGRVDGPLTADFRPAIRPFYESIGFDVDGSGENERLRGRLHERFD
ncbi:GNAT family N-acetyltransferase [Halorarum halophilum]|uniref:GNAT family N-acetyltransferase n=1 Tax=Halorarum halophilum TaxID=2743090 RepID=A0A7D5GFS5_9EURY|nr:GNAT family N-acetyltransferase [Halobaculum halophilum]QLG28488.1 GNAT family N-acetyltransferase [Halobaculum halophilum]